jgi:CRP-like cAMP-binding protein
MRAILSPTLPPGASAKSVTGEHPFAYLPGSTISQHAKQETIYFQGEPASRVYLVVEGKVKILGHESRRVVVDVYGSDDLFGESVLAGHAHRVEEAVTLEPTRLMSWTQEEIENNTASSPEFATAMIRFAVRRSLELTIRIESLAREKIEQRLTRALIGFARRFGWEAEDGTVKMDALTHEFLSQYVGTSREIVSQHMSRFRRAGYLHYSRTGISLQRRALVAWQTEQSATGSRRSAAQAN